MWQNLRGGRVKLQSIIMPDMEFGNTEKGDALYAMELALSLEKLNNEKLLALHKVAEECDDPQMTDYVDGTFLGEQVRGGAHLPLGRRCTALGLFVLRPHRT